MDLCAGVGANYFPNLCHYLIRKITLLRRLLRRKKIQRSGAVFIFVAYHVLVQKVVSETPFQEFLFFCTVRGRNMRGSVARSPLRLSSSLGIDFRSFSSVPWKLGQENFTKSFSHLQKDAVSKKRGQFVHLPQLYDERELAKALRTEDCASFLLTEERLALWEEMNKASGSYSERLRLDGTCLSGPNGVGKSSVLHMLASVAHVNNWIVLYIVSF